MIIGHKRIGYYLNAMRQSACLVINSIAVDNFAALFNSVHAGGSGIKPYDGPGLKLFTLVGWGRSCRLLLGPPGLNW